MSALKTPFLTLTTTISLLILIFPTYLPLNLLRLLPVLSSTINLMWAIDEYQFLSSWLHPTYRPQANALLPPWFATWGRMASLVLFSSFPLSLSSSIANILTSASPLSLDGAVKWYWAGLAFTMAHFLYGKKALGLLAAIRNGEPKGNPTESLGVWIRMHITRFFTADLPAFVAFVGALLMSMEIVA